MLNFFRAIKRYIDIERLESLERAGLARRDGDVWARVYVKVVEVVKVKQMEMFA